MALRTLFFCFLLVLSVSAQAKDISVSIFFKNYTNTQPQRLHILELGKSFEIPDTTCFTVSVPQKGTYTFMVETDEKVDNLMLTKEISRKKDLVRFELKYKRKFLVSALFYLSHKEEIIAFSKKYEVGFEQPASCDMSEDYPEYNQELEAELTEEYGDTWRKEYPGYEAKKRLDSIKSKSTYPKDSFLVFGMLGSQPSEAEREFSEKYNVHFSHQGCLILDYAAAVTHNKVLADRLTELHGESWKSELPFSLFGVK
ncbi:MAG: hypothetical protein AAF740_00735 [Bacteroidota bacterium]